MLTRIVLSSVLLFFLASCSVDEKNLIDRRNYKKLIQNLEMGYAYDNSMEKSIHVLDELGIYLEKNKESIYKESSSRFFYHMGLVQLYSADFLQSFQTLKDYIDTTGDQVGPYYHLGQVLRFQNKYSGQDILSLCAISQDRPDQTKLAISQHRALAADIDGSPGYPFLWLDESTIPDEVKKSKEYQNAYQLHRNATHKMELAIELGIEWGTISSVLTEEHVAQFENKPNPSEKEIDFMVAYHLHPYHVDYERAAQWADRRTQPVQRGDGRNYSITCKLMRAYLGVDRYDDAIRVYELNKEQVSEDMRELKASQDHLFLYVSAAYAGKGDLDRSLEYLERELSITEIHKSWLYTEAPKTIEDLITKGDMLYSLFAMVFLLEEFEQFERAGRQSDLEKMVERHVSRYHHLPVFREN